MKFTHPNGLYDHVVVNGTSCMGEVERMDAGMTGWVTIGRLGDNGTLLIDREEWPAFMALVKEIDEARK